MKEKQKLDRRDTYTATNAPHVRISVELQSCITGLALGGPCYKHIQHRKSIIIKGVEKNMDRSTKKVKLVNYGKRLRFTAQFLPTFVHGVSLEGVR